MEVPDPPHKEHSRCETVVPNGSWKKKEVDVMIQDGSGKIAAARSAR